MSKLDSLAESKPMLALQKMGIAFQSNKAISAISSSMMVSMGIIMAGSIFTMIATLLYLVGAIQTTDPLYTFLTMPNGMTLGLISVIVSFAVGYIYSQNLGMKGPLSNGVVCMILFLIVASPVKSVVLQDGSPMNVLDTTYLGATGMFTAFLVAIVSVRLIKFASDHHISIKMPDVVPAFLSDAFSSLIPLMVGILLWGGVSTACQSFAGTTLPGVIVGLLMVPMSGLISVPGMIVLNTIGVLLWGFGIHGAAAISVITMPAMFQAYQQNAALVAAGQATEFSPTFLGAATGSSAEMLIAFILMSIFLAKSQQLKAVGKACLVPALFNITEPITFGAPIMGNPLLILPQIIGGIIWPIVTYAGYAIGFFQNGHILLLMNMPYALQEFLPAMAWQNLLIAPLGTLIGFLVFFPFFKVYDKQLLKREQGDAAAE